MNRGNIYTFDSQELISAKNYWLENLKGELVKSSIPFDFKENGFSNNERMYLEFDIPKELSSKVLRISNGSDLRLHSILVAAFNTLIYKYLALEDIILGVPILTEFIDENLVNKILPIRSKIDKEISFKELLIQVKNKINEANKNQNYPIENIFYKLDLKVIHNTHPLVDIIILLENIHSDKNIETLNTNIKIAFSRNETNISGKLDFNAKVYTKKTMENLVKNFISCFQACINNIGIKLSDVELLSKDEKYLILNVFNNTKLDYDKQKLIHEFFEEQVERSPEAIAVVYGKNKLTYRELNEKSNQLARLIRNKIKDKPNKNHNYVIGIMVERSLEMIIGIFGILKAGAAYLPIGYDYPLERIKYMIENSSASVLLTQRSLKDKIQEKLEVICLDDNNIYQGDKDNLEKINSSKDLAYVIYTSGSTGNPKGVMIEHYSVINRLNWMQNKYPLDKNDVIMQKTPITFDVSVWELFWWTFVGAQVCLIKQGEERNPQSIVNTICNHKITTLHFVPPMLNVFLEYSINNGVEKLSSLKRVFSSGEVLNVNQVVKFNKELNAKYNVTLHNLYGPTEATVDVTYFDCTPWNQRKIVPIGKPISNTNIYILDGNDKLQPIGIEGEICISGDGIARGYLNREDLSKEKFVINPFVSGTYMYRTGDIGKWLPDGNVEFIGRKDLQVKIRGFRIELSEIEYQLLKIKEVKEVAVKDFTNKEGMKYICAYLVSEGNIDIDSIRNALANELPDYMIPSYFVKLYKLTCKANGKIDKQALPDPLECASIGVEYVAPTDEIEEKLVAIWSALIHINKIGINDPFFDMGGNSIMLVNMHSMIEKEFKVNITIADLFSYPTIRQLGDFIRNNIKGESNNVIRLDSFILPEEYYATSWTQSKQSSFQFEVDLETIDKMKNIAIEENSTLNDIFVSLYAYLFYKITNESNIFVQTAIYDIDKVVPVKFEFDSITNFKEMFGVVRKTINKENEFYHKNGYVNKTISYQNERSVYLFFYDNENITRDFINSDSLNIVMSVEKIDGRVIYYLEYNSKVFDSHHMENFVQNYINLINFIVNK
ncbi:non-ribosomal peptide synthetase [Clostridium frigidicarnis]|uniref:Amino acid adenylation domain-containing protein n=1 Tax=Clostridium frigidicarnis TaxID=84698 RepID=A0A1I0Y3B2_9CLOT|nr:non-ribosomal peptide synthetase [Clostridium frigidicarnis]SFB07654.1 amino acid adenylation domain-containing protein [Clostridium frigidicarnis]